MDASRFDRIVRTWAEAGSRRPILGLLAGSAAGLAGLTHSSGKRKKKKKVTLCLNGETITVPKKKQGSYLSQGATSGKCPATCVPQCAGKTCEPDGCGGTCDNCPGDLTCQGGACACPPETFDCGSNVCFPNPVQCCTNEDCGSGRRCVRGQCMAWQGTCPAWGDTCTIEYSASCGQGNCRCYQSTEGETRCGGGAEPNPPCGVCQTTADCEARFPDIPGVFCVDKGDKPNCCPGACVRPCPTT